MDIEVTLPFRTEDREYMATVKAFIIAHPEPVCIIHELNMFSVDSAPLGRFTVTDEDYDKIEGYIWRRFNEAAGAELVELESSDEDDVDDPEEDDCEGCTSCNCTDKSLH
jgi:acetoin utilization deacetylase AcuC-like enzyme